MDFFDLLTMVGGLALFLYGMDVMGDGLAKTSGGKLEQILEKLTSTPIKAVLLGAGVTAVIQSSSATTVMVVGFVNSGIMKLSQAVGIIMGANVGTTITSWILSLTGIELLYTAFKTVLIRSDFSINRNLYDDADKGQQEKRHCIHYAWICGPDVWYGNYE